MECWLLLPIQALLSLPSPKYTLIAFCCFKRLSNRFFAVRDKADAFPCSVFFGSTQRSSDLVRIFPEREYHKRVFSTEPRLADTNAILKKVLSGQ